MKKFAIVLLVLSCGMAAFAQFFSLDEIDTKKEEQQFETSLSENQQKELYIAVCAADKKAEEKSIGLNPVKIHHTPEQREERKQKAQTTKQKLLDHYKASLAKSYNITLEYLEEVVLKGDKEGWPKTKEAPASE